MANIGGIKDPEFLKNLKELYDSETDEVKFQRISPVMSALMNSKKINGGLGLNRYQERGIDGSIESTNDFDYVNSGIEYFSGIASTQKWGNKILRGKINFDSKEMALTRTELMAYVPQLMQKVKRNVNTYRMEKQLNLATDEACKLTTVLASTIIQTGDLFTIQVTDPFRLEDGLVFELFDTATNNFIGGNINGKAIKKFQVIAHKRFLNGASSYTVTIKQLTGDIINLVLTGTTHITLRNSITIGATPAENKYLRTNGLENIISRDGMLGGIDRILPGNEFFSSPKFDGGSTELTTGILRKSTTVSRNNTSKTMPHILVARDQVVDAFEETLESFKQYNANGSSFDTYITGYTDDTILFDGKPLIKDAVSTPGTLRGIDTNEFFVAELKPWGFMDEDGLSIRQEGQGFLWRIDQHEICEFGVKTLNSSFEIHSLIEAKG